MSTGLTSYSLSTSQHPFKVICPVFQTFPYRWGECIVPIVVPPEYP